MATIPTQAYSPVSTEMLPMLDLLRNLGAVLKTDSQLNAWCNINMGQDLHVFSGSDPEHPPQRDKYPLVEIFPLTDNVGRDAAQYEATIGLVAGVYDDALEPVVYNDFEIQRGIIRLEELYQLIILAMNAANLSGGILSASDARRDDEVLFPFFVLGAELKIIKPL